LGPEDIPTLYSGQLKYWFSSKSDGVRYQLYFTKVDDIPISCFINRADQVFVLPIPAPESFYKGTLLDADLIDSTLEYHIYNCIQMNGRSCRKESYLQRMQIAQNALVIWYYFIFQRQPSWLAELLHDDRKDCITSITSDSYESFQKRWILSFTRSVCPIRFWVKPIFSLWQFQWFTRLIEPLWKRDFPSDGYTLTPNEESEQKGYKGKVYKLKFGTDNTIDLEIQMSTLRNLPPSSPSYYIQPPPLTSWRTSLPMDTPIALLYTYEFTETTQAKLFSAARVPLEWKTVATAAASLDKKIVECRWDEKQQEWKIEKIRQRKSANALPTVMATLKTIRANLSVEDVFVFLKHKPAQEQCFQPSSFLSSPGKLHIRMPMVYRFCKKTSALHEES
jgi:hypothetical protein